MEEEVLNIYDDKRNHIGVAPRKEVHEKGYWHEAFHCWFIGVDEEKTWLYLQLRSRHKKDYPYLLDITAAGHLLSHETVRDGVREVHEEIGIDIAYEELIPLGTLDYCVQRANFIDKEIAHVFLFNYSNSMEDFILQEDEVAGMVKVDFSEFASLWECNVEAISIEGFEIQDNADKIKINKTVGREMFVPHDHAFYRAVIARIRENV